MSSHKKVSQDIKMIWKLFIDQIGTVGYTVGSSAGTKHFDAQMCVKGPKKQHDMVQCRSFHKNCLESGLERTKSEGVLISSGGYYLVSSLPLYMNTLIKNDHFVIVT